MFAAFSAVHIAVSLNGRKGSSLRLRSTEVHVVAQQCLTESYVPSSLQVVPVIIDSQMFAQDLWTQDMCHFMNVRQKKLDQVATKLSETR